VSWYCEKAPSKRPQTHKSETELRAAERPRPPCLFFRDRPRRGSLRQAPSVTHAPHPTPLSR
jgi:hypothetical protein